MVVDQNCNFEPCTNIQSLRRFDFDSWKTQSKFIANSNIRTTFWKVSSYASFFHKNCFVFINQIWHYEALNQYAMAQKFWWRILSFWQTLKQIYRKLQYRANVFGKSQSLPCFSRKIFLYALTKFKIFWPCANTQSLWRSDLGSWLTLKQVFG